PRSMALRTSARGITRAATVTPRGVEVTNGKWSPVTCSARDTKAGFGYRYGRCLAEAEMTSIARTKNETFEILTILFDFILTADLFKRLITALPPVWVFLSNA